jgi:acetylornithine deacetylase
MSTSIKERILAEIDDEEVIDFAKAICRVPSFTTEETEVARFLHDFFQKEGLDSELQEVEPGRFQTIARLKGQGGGQSLMFNGHIDIDPLPSGWKTDPWEPVIDGDRFIAAGIYNMKSGDTAMIMATIAAKRAGVPLKGDVVIAAVVGELQGGVGTRYLMESGLRTDLAIVPEPYTTKNVITKHTGVMQFGVHVRGQAVHISRKAQGLNAILKMAKLVQALDAIEFRFTVDPDLSDLPLINVGTILGGRGDHWEFRGPYLIPDRCVVYVDVRFNASMTPESVLEDVRAALDAVCAEDPEIDYEIELPITSSTGLGTTIMTPLALDKDHPLVQTLVANVREIAGLEPTVGAVRPYSYAGNDTSHLYAAGIPCVLYGPGGGLTEDGTVRWTSVQQILDCTRIFGATIADLCA